MSQPATFLGGEADRTRSAPHVQLLHVPDCPNVDRVRALMTRSLAKTGALIRFEEIEGDYPSPTLLIDGIDVTGHDPGTEPCCRLDLPSEEDVIAALFRSQVQEPS